MNNQKLKMIVRFPFCFMRKIQENPIKCDKNLEFPNLKFPKKFSQYQKNKNMKNKLSSSSNKNFYAVKNFPISFPYDFPVVVGKFYENFV